MAQPIKHGQFDSAGTTCCLVCCDCPSFYSAPSSKVSNRLTCVPVSEVPVRSATRAYMLVLYVHTRSGVYLSKLYSLRERTYRAIMVDRNLHLCTCLCLQQSAPPPPPGRSLPPVPAAQNDKVERHGHVTMQALYSGRRMCIDRPTVRFKFTKILLFAVIENDRCL